jgi:hypothetical protein
MRNGVLFSRESLRNGLLRRWRTRPRNSYSVDLVVQKQPKSAAGVADGTYRLAGDCHNEIPSMRMKRTAAIAAWRQL